MSWQCFQANLARLVIDLEFRARVRARGATALEGELTALERARLASAAADRGLDATRMLYTSFRLSKLLITLPLTCTLLGPARLRRAAPAPPQRCAPRRPHGKIGALTRAAPPYAPQRF